MTNSFGLLSFKSVCVCRAYRHTSCGPLVVSERERYTRVSNLKWTSLSPFVHSKPSYTSNNPTLVGNRSSLRDECVVRVTFSEWCKNEEKMFFFLFDVHTLTLLSSVLNTCICD